MYRKNIINLKLFFSLILAIVAILSCYAFFNAKTISANALTFNEKEDLISLNDAQTYNLYSSSGSVNDYFTFEGVAEYYNESNSTEIIYRSESICIGTAKYNAEYYAIFKMSDSLYDLAKQGLVDITAYANFCSPVNTGVTGDSPEKITMSFRSATSVDVNLLGKYVIGNVEYGSFSKSTSNQQKSYAQSDYSLSLNGITDRYLVLQFSSEYSAAGIRTTCNYMNVKQPRVVVSYKKFSVNYNYGLNSTSVAYGSQLTVDVPSKAGYETYKCFVNNKEVDIINNKVTFNVTSNTNVEFKYRKILSLDIKNEYYYNDGNAIQLEYICDENINNINFEYIYNGEKVSEIDKVGLYTVKYSYSDDSFVLSGEKTINVLSVPYDITVLDSIFVYDGKVKELNVNNPRNFRLNISITNDGGESEPINAGVYSYTIKVDEYGYVGEAYGSFEIQKQKVELESLDLDSVEYNGETQFIEYQSDYKFDLLYTQDDIIVEPVNAGEYICKVKLQEENFEGETSFSYVILPRKVKFIAGKYETTYGEPLKNIEIQTINGIEGVDYNIAYSADIKNEAGMYDIIINRLQNDPNYEFYYENGVYNVNKKVLTIIPDAGQSKFFGEKDTPLTYSIEGLINDDILTGDIAREGGENAGNYLILVGTLSNKNYNIEVVNEYYKIYPQKMVIVGKSYSKIYGENDPEIFEYEIISTTIENYQLSGKLERVEGENVGVYNIGLGTLKDPNLNIILIQGQLEILPKKIEVCANYGTKNYSDPDKLSYSSIGLLEGDILFGELTREPGENVGKYNIEIGTLNSPNYTINFTSNVYEILPKNLKIKAKNQFKIYGEKDPVLSFETEETFIQTQVVGALSRVAGESVGEYEINIGTLSSVNYNLIYESSKLIIEPKNCTVYSSSKTKEYGNNDPSFDFKIDGIINNDDAGIVVSRETGEDCGKYALQIIGNNINYLFEFDKKYCLEIIKATPNISVEDFIMNYNGNAFTPNEYLNEEFIYHYSLNGKEIDQPLDAGEYEYYVEYIGSSNYNPTISNVSKIKINKLILPITITYTSFIYDGNVHEPIFVTNDENLELSVSFNDLSPEAVGEHEFIITSSNKNYESISGVVNIMPAKSTSEIKGISMQLIGGNVSNNNMDNIKFSVSSINNTDSIYELDVSNQKIIKAFKTDFNNLVDSSKFTVEIDSIDLNLSHNIHIYAIDSSNNLIEVQYEINDGIISFETENANLSYIITAYSKTYISIYQIIIIFAMLMFALYLHFISRKFIKKIKVKKVKKSKKA